MAKPGPPKTPTSLALVKGERKDRINTREPVPAQADVDPPEWLVGEALEVWEFYAPDMKAKGVLQVWDVDRFAIVCQAVADYREANRHLAEDGPVIEAEVFNRNGEVTGHRTVKSPWLSVRTDAWTVIARESGLFGWSPSDRARLVIDHGEDDKSRSPERLLS